jgi:hypothetical protein
MQNTRPQAANGPGEQGGLGATHFLAPRKVVGSFSPLAAAPDSSPDVRSLGAPREIGHAPKMDSRG